MSPSVPKEPSPPVILAVETEATDSGLRLPAAPRASDAPDKLETLRLAVRGVTRDGPERILIVDDEPQLRRLFKKALEQHGYEVDAASDGTEALNAFEASRSRFGESPVVVLDLTLDGEMDGVEILRALRERDPAARIIASTGLGTPAEELRAQGFSGVLRKPYALSELFAAILGLRESSSP